MLKVDMLVLCAHTPPNAAAFTRNCPPYKIFSNQLSPARSLHHSIPFLNFGTVYSTATKLRKLRKAHCSPPLVGEDNSMVLTSHLVHEWLEIALGERQNHFIYFTPVTVNKYSTLSNKKCEVIIVMGRNPSK